MDLNGKIVSKFDKLIPSGNTVWKSSQRTDEHGNTYGRPNDQIYHRWLIESLNLILKVCGEKSQHYRQMLSYAENTEYKGNSHYMSHCVGILEAAYNDYKDGFLFNTRSFISAELHADFLEQAEYLNSNGYHCAAASLAGAVLESSLRKLCDKYEIPIKAKSNINSLSMLLVDKKVFDRIAQREINTKEQIRNEADHGHFDNVKSDDVSDMIKWIIRFNSDYLK